VLHLGTPHRSAIKYKYKMADGYYLEKLKNHNIIVTNHFGNLGGIWHSVASYATVHHRSIKGQDLKIPKWLGCHLEN